MAVWFGLISYPLYLWHWVLLSFAKSIDGDTPPASIRTLAIALSALLAWITFRYIERPIRTGNSNIKTAHTLCLLTIAMGVIGLCIFFSNGFSHRFPKLVADLANYSFDYKAEYREGVCFLTAEQNYTAYSDCPSDPAIGRPTILLWGDSHAAHYYPGLKELSANRYRVTQRTASGRPRILNLEKENRIHCKDINDFILMMVKENPPTRIILSANWTSYDVEKLSETIFTLKSIGIKNIDLIGPPPNGQVGYQNTFTCVLKTTPTKKSLTE